MVSRLLFRQLLDFESYTYTYLLGCRKTRKAILIDPVDTQTARDIKLIEELELELLYAINTHVHADHITGTGILKHLTGCKSMLSEASGGKADIHLTHKQKIAFGDQVIEARSTPGHTNGCMTFVHHDNKMAFTGDALLVRACGRTDFQEGSPETLYDSVQSQIFSLPNDFVLYPAHDYKGNVLTTVEEEKKHNPRLTKTKEEFVKIMDNLGLTRPKRIDEALPVNLMCGPSQLGRVHERMDE